MSEKPKRRKSVPKVVLVDDETSTSALRLDNAKRILGGAAIVLLLGLGLDAIGDLSIGPYVTVGALALGIYGAHKLGRSGKDPGIFTRS